MGFQSWCSMFDAEGRGGGKMPLVGCLTTFLGSFNLIKLSLQKCVYIYMCIYIYIFFFCKI